MATKTRKVFFERRKAGLEERLPAPSANSR
jgi:hypothetical protein